MPFNSLGRGVEEADRSSHLYWVQFQDPAGICILHSILFEIPFCFCLIIYYPLTNWYVACSVAECEGSLRSGHKGCASTSKAAEEEEQSSEGLLNIVIESRCHEGKQRAKRRKTTDNYSLPALYLLPFALVFSAVKPAAFADYCLPNWQRTRSFSGEINFDNGLSICLFLSIY